VVYLTKMTFRLENQQVREEKTKFKSFVIAGKHILLCWHANRPNSMTYHTDCHGHCVASQ